MNKNLPIIKGLYLKLKDFDRLWMKRGFPSRKHVYHLTVQCAVKPGHHYIVRLARPPPWGSEIMAFWKPSKTRLPETKSPPPQGHVGCNFVSNIFITIRLKLWKHTAYSLEHFQQDDIFYCCISITWLVMTR